MSHYHPIGQFPGTRLRRNRRWDWSRRVVAENTLSTSDLMYPIFVRYPEISDHIDMMPGVNRYTLAELPALIDKVATAGIPAVCLFPVLPPELKNEMADACLDPEGLLPSAVRLIKKYNPDIGVITDGALDAFTSHGHDGLVFNDYVDNDKSVERIRDFALIQAQAGADMIAPSDMMDGRVGAIRATLDQHGLIDVGILAYSAKYASAFYTPFREALQSGVCLGKAHKKTYQMDPSNNFEALHEIAQDIAEGADMVMIKPGLPYLDIIYQVQHTFKIPTVAYHVSGEYAMLKAAAQNGWLNNDAALLEIMLAFKRAGTSAVITYAALELAQLIRERYR